MQKNFYKDFYNYEIPELKQFNYMVDIVTNYSLASRLNLFSTVSSIKHIQRNQLNGHFVECGVYKGGNVLLMAMMNEKLNLKRDVYAFDTYEGMPLPEEKDERFNGVKAKEIFEIQKKLGQKWMKSSLENTKKNISKHVKSIDLIKFIKGNVSQTLDNKSNIPDQISLLRIDTDLYDSTKKSLNILYPKVVINGLIIIDDYGHWKGCREAVDEYLINKNYYMSIIDASCRLIIKLK